MKKLLLIGLAATAMLTSCSKDETVEVTPSNAIKFDNAFVDNSTRSFVDPSLSMTNLEDFSVWSFMDEATGVVMDGVKVSKSGASWTYTPLAYWVGGHTYTFEAVAPATGAIWTPVVNGGDLTGIKVTTNTGKQDILYATAEKTTPAKMETSPGAVAFTFKHMLAKVKFTFANAYTNANYTIKVSNIKIVNAYRAGEYNMTAWTGSDETLALNFGAATLANGAEPGKIEIGQKAESNEELLLIPSTVEKSYKITFTAELSVGTKVAGTYNLTSTITGAALEMGKSYNFTASLDHTNINPDGGTDFPIEFTVTEIEGWQNGGDVPQTL